METNYLSLDAVQKKLTQRHSHFVQGKIDNTCIPIKLFWKDYENTK